MPEEPSELIIYLKKMLDQQEKMLAQQEKVLAQQEEMLARQERRLQAQAEDIRQKDELIISLQQTIANLNETVAELNRSLYGASSEKTKIKPPEDDPVVIEAGEPKQIRVAEYTRSSKPKSIRADLYAALPVEDIFCPADENEKECPYCKAQMEHLAYKPVREELRIIPAKVIRVIYHAETCICPACRNDGDTTLIQGKTPTALLPHSMASPSSVAYVMFQKLCLELPFYRQEFDLKQRGAPIGRETQANWFNTCTALYLKPVFIELHKELAARDVLHVDEVPCQVLHEPGREATAKSYMWVYATGNDGKPKIILYDYRPGRSGDYPIEFLAGYRGYIHCDGYTAYGRIEDVQLACCTAHLRRKFYDAVPASRRKQLKLLDINSDEEIRDPDADRPEGKITPAEQGVIFCNRLFFIERRLKNLSAEGRMQEREKLERPVWDEFWEWLATLNPAGGSKLEKAVTYAVNHRESLMTYLQDGRLALSNNAAERSCKSYVMGRKNFLFHDQVKGAEASAIVLSLIETAKANGLNVFQYLYTLLLYMVDYKHEPAAIKQLMPWSEFIHERCSGLTDVETEKPENRGRLPL